MTQAKNPLVTFNMTYGDDRSLLQAKRGTTVETTYTFSPTTTLHLPFPTFDVRKED